MPHERLSGALRRCKIGEVLRLKLFVDHAGLTATVVARADGTYPRRLAALGKLDLLVLDDWGLTPLTDEGRRG